MTSSRKITKLICVSMMILFFYGEIIFKTHCDELLCQLQTHGSQCRTAAAAILKKPKKWGVSRGRRSVHKVFPRLFGGSCTNGYCPPFLFFLAMSLVSGAVMLELLQLLLGPNSIMRGASSWFFF